MRLILLTLLTMAAFAANSVLNRWAVAPGHASATDFAAIRLLAGAAMLLGLVLLRGRFETAGAARLGPFWTRDGVGMGRRIAGVLGLSAYMLGFSLAYRGLDAGTGALVLFGMVQVTMLTGAVILGEPVPLRRWLGAAIALVGLAVIAGPVMGLPTLGLPLGGNRALTPPPDNTLAFGPLALMTLAGLGWGAYSLAGRAARDPMGETAVNFALAVPLVLPFAVLDGGAAPDAQGVALAVVAGAVTSGLGYALWYAILPALGAGRAAVAQLSVPVLAGLGGAVWLADMPAPGFWAAAVLVLGGVALGSLPARVRP